MVDIIARRMHSKYLIFREHIILVLPLIILHIFMLWVSSNYGLEKYATYGDGLEYINLARAITRDPIYVIANIHPPIYPILIKAFSTLTSYETASLLVNASAHTLLIIPIYQALKLTVPSDHRKLAIIYSVFPPAIITYSSIGLSDTLAILFSAFFFYFLLKRSEKGMILSSLLAVLTHQIVYLLIIPMGIFYLKQRPKRLYRVFIITIPFILLSLYRYSQGQGITYYINTHFTFAEVYWDSRLFSLPFESLIRVIMSTSIKSGGAEQSVSPYSILYVVFMLLIYVGGVILSERNRDTVVLSYSLPFIIFLVFYQIWFFIPRFITYCFPLLFSYGRLMSKSRIILALALTLSALSIVYSFYFLLYIFPLTY